MFHGQIIDCSKNKKDLQIGFHRSVRALKQELVIINRTGGKLSS